MPLEVSPAPFAAAQRLPYTPAFARSDQGSQTMIPSLMGGGGGTQGGVGGWGDGGYAHGPGPGLMGSTGSMVIPPAPGGIADPHHAIPALPEAGYTAPPLRSRALSIDSRSHPSGSIYNPGHPMSGHHPAQSVYSSVSPSAHPHMEHHHPFVHVHSPLSVIQSEGDRYGSNSLPSPRRGPPLMIPQESVIAPKTHHHHHHHDQHHGPTQARYDLGYESDSASDASYYAMPKHKHHHQQQHRATRSRSGSVSSVSDAETSPRELHVPQVHHHRSRSITSHTHTPRSPSLPPTGGRMHSPISPSPLAGSVAHGHGQGHKMSPAPAEEEKRPRLHSHLPSEGEEESVTHDHKERGRHHSRPRSHSHSHSHSHSGDGHGGAVRRHNSANHHRNHHQHQPRHHRHRSGSHLPPPPPPEWDHNRPSTPPSHLPPPSMLGVPLPGEPGGYRRRAVSMQGLERDCNLLPVSSGGAAQSQGYGQAMTYAHAPRGVNVDGSVYEDGASAAGSQMTFMDGSVDGRTSQYGLPKYSYPRKDDYRRYCLQRGNADVYI
ncbi:hypothetical protein CI109_102227 [Kwoniella shandongensis]|uniref:Uncharacterized protein n=1 Tax=Kwoniella shandongensis TaxID=1734106 RepID=A0AAJ8MVP8_9TREE